MRLYIGLLIGLIQYPLVTKVTGTKSVFHTGPPVFNNFKLMEGIDYHMLCRQVFPASLMKTYFSSSSEKFVRRWWIFWLRR